MNRHGRRFARTLVLASLLCASVAAAAQERITIVIGGLDKIIYLPVLLADRLGYFRDEGLNVVLRSRPAGVEAADSLLAGNVQGVIGFYDHTIELQVRGKAVQSVVQLGMSPGQAVLVSNRAAAVDSVAAAEGRRWGVTGLGASTNFLSEYLIAAAGLRPGQVRFVPVGAGDAFIAAMKEGRIDVGMTSEPTVSRLLASGDARMLVDLRTREDAQRVLGGLYPAACLYMQTSWVHEHRAQVRALVRALLKALVYIRDHGAEDIAAVVPPEYRLADRATYVKALAGAKDMFTTDGVMPASSPSVALAVLARVNRRVREKPVDLARTYTTEFVSTAR